jgi:ElaB/YqjD/DUF883 family membrane-anchored ribosome-binding protein
MDIATILKSTANCLMVLGAVKLLGTDLKAEIRSDARSLREKVNCLVQDSPYSAAGLAAAAGALTGFALRAKRNPRTILTRL